uniref:Uncharacterized protein n=1 Tax=Arundo donax TaxID=35708 RepID=A0A0A9DB78_ARUDO
MFAAHCKGQRSNLKHKTKQTSNKMALFDSATNICNSQQKSKKAGQR